jgi:hypothetical protein
MDSYTLCNHFIGNTQKQDGEKHAENHTLCAEDEPVPASAHSFLEHHFSYVPGTRERRKQDLTSVLKPIARGDNGRQQIRLPDAKIQPIPHTAFFWTIILWGQKEEHRGKCECVHDVCTHTYTPQTEAEYLL